MTIGLTGGIGSGKSTVAKVFALMGCKVISSDELAKQSYFKPTVKKQIVALLGAEAYLSESQLNKAYIANQIFNNSNLLQQSNAIIHPEVKKEFQLFTQQHPQDLIIKETALLFEAGLAADVDKRVVVVAPDDLRIKRVV
ncbi:MAG: dephospho-CoA kinase, partial [Bacteroidota bacterium]